MKLFKKQISRRNFLKNALFSGLAALGLVTLSSCGAGGGAIFLSATSSGAGESGDEPTVEPVGGDDGNIVDTGQSVEWVEVWKVDPLYDATTGEKVGVFGGPDNPDQHFPKLLYNKLRGLADRYLFRFDLAPQGRYNCPGLRKLNWRFNQACEGAGVPGYKPLLVSFMMRKDIADILFGNGRYIDRYEDANVTKVQEYIFNQLYSDEQDWVEW